MCIIQVIYFPYMVWTCNDKYTRGSVMIGMDEIDASLLTGENTIYYNCEEVLHLTLTGDRK